MSGAGAALALVALAAPAGAQSLNDWNLPPAPTQTPRAEGPVDSQNPVVTAPAPRPAVSPTPTPAPTPVPTLRIPSPAARPSATPSAATRPVERPSPASAAPRAATPAPTTEPSPASTPTSPMPAAPVQPGSDAPAPAISEAPMAEAPAVEAAGGNSPSWWWAAPAGLAALALAWFLLRRRRQEPEDIDFAPETAPELSPQPAPDVEDTARPQAPAPAFIPPASTAQPSSAPPPRARGQLQFEPIALRLSLVYATLQFRLRLTAETAIPPGRLLGDMISAHASLPQDVQLAPAADALPVMTALQPLAPGEVFDAQGEIRLPLAAIRPLRQGQASFLVPLVRLALIGDGNPAAPHLELGCVFTVGQPGSGPSLAPLRLDTGPRDFTELDAREIEAARRTALFPLDPARAAG